MIGRSVRASTGKAASPATTLARVGITAKTAPFAAASATAGDAELPPSCGGDDDDADDGGGVTARESPCACAATLTTSVGERT